METAYKKPNVKNVGLAYLVKEKKLNIKKIIKYKNLIRDNNLDQKLHNNSGHGCDAAASEVS